MPDIDVKPCPVCGVEVDICPDESCKFCRGNQPCASCISRIAREAAMERPPVVVGTGEARFGTEYRLIYGTTGNTTGTYTAIPTTT